MGSFSIWHFIILLLYLVVFVVPSWRIVSKAGYSGAWALLMLVPLVNIVALWLFAFSRWPYEKKNN